MLSNALLIRAYAECVADCQVRMLTGFHCASATRPVAGTLGDRRGGQVLPNTPNWSKAQWLDTALARLRKGTAFFGLTGQWNQSVRLYAHLAGIPVEAVMFKKGRSSTADADMKVAFRGLAVETGWDGGVDAELYSHAEAIFQGRVAVMATEQQQQQQQQPSVPDPVHEPNHREDPGRVVGAGFLMTGFDADADGAVSKEEFLDVLVRFAGEHAHVLASKPAPGDLVAAVFGAFDANGDEVLDEQEFRPREVWDMLVPQSMADFLYPRKP